MQFEYYYNNVPGVGYKTRNNLIYTSLISADKKVFCQWYHNDSEYHKGQNQVIDPKLMDQKFNREVKYLTLMSNKFPNMVPKILDIDISQKKIFLEIEGDDFWQQSLDRKCSFDLVASDWQEQMIEIFRAYRELGWYKYSLHPSSYFVVGGILKSINYFFTYSEGEGPITVRDHLSHISEQRRKEMKPKTDVMGIGWDEPQNLLTMQILTFESFRNNYPSDFIEKAKNVFL
jgi:hypothetical protein